MHARFCNGAAGSTENLNINTSFVFLTFFSISTKFFAKKHLVNKEMFSITLNQLQLHKELEYGVKNSSKIEGNPLSELNK